MTSLKVARQQIRIKGYHWQIIGVRSDGTLVLRRKHLVKMVGNSFKERK